MKGVGSCQEFFEERQHSIRAAARKALWIMRCTDPESHAEDVSSDVIRKVVAHWNNLVSPERVLYSIVTNAARDHIKVCLAEVAHEIHDSASPSFSPASQDPEEMLAEALLISELLSLLNQNERDVIQLSFCGYSSEEISELMHMPSATVRSIKTRAIAKMRKIAVNV